MSFYSQHAGGIWDDLYTVLIPEQVTMNRDFVKKFGVYTSGNKEIDKMMASNYTTVRIPIIKIVEYFEDGVPVEIPSREDMVTMHKKIELYLEEWRDYIRKSFHGDPSEHKNLIMNLERLSKHIYLKAKPKEVIENLFTSKKIGLLNPFQEVKEDAKEVTKPDYNSIAELLRGKGVKPQGSSYHRPNPVSKTNPGNRF